MHATPDPQESDAMPSAHPVVANVTAPGTHTPPPIPTDFLFRGRQEILIAHNGEHYRLRITRNGKLILTK